MRLIRLLIIVLALIFLAQTVEVRAEETGVVTICFDDANESVFSLAYPKLHYYSIRATLFVITGSVQNRPYWHMGWEQIKVLSDQGWEIGSHSHSHRYMTEMGMKEVRQELEISKKILEERGFRVYSFAAPFGNVNNKVLKEIKKLYKAHRGTEEPDGQLERSLNDLAVDPYNICSIELKYEYGFDMAKILVDRAISKKQWVVFFLHSLTLEHPSPTKYQYSLAELGKLMAYLSELRNEGRVRIMTISEYLTSRE